MAGYVRSHRRRRREHGLPDEREFLLLDVRQGIVVQAREERVTDGSNLAE